MDHRVPRVGVTLGIVLALAAVATFLFLNRRFEGPVDPLGALGSERTMTAVFPDTKKLPTKQPALLKGVTVGRVAAVDWLPERRASRVTFTVKDGVATDSVIQTTVCNYDSPAYTSTHSDQSECGA